MRQRRPLSRRDSGHNRLHASEASRTSRRGPRTRPAASFQPVPIFGVGLGSLERGRPSGLRSKSEHLILLILWRWLRSSGAFARAFYVPPSGDRRLFRAATPGHQRYATPLTPARSSQTSASRNPLTPKHSDMGGARRVNPNDRFPRGGTRALFTFLVAWEIGGESCREGHSGLPS